MKKQAWILVAIMMAAGTAQAGTVYWDGGTISIGGNGNGASGGGAGTWDTVTANWDVGVSPHVTWTNANNDIAVLGGTAGTVTLTEPITVGGLVITAADTIQSNTLSFGAAGTISNTAALTISSILSGTGPITKSGVGILTLSGSNSYTGGTVLIAGELDTAVDANFGNGGGVTVNGNATWYMGAAVATYNRDLTINNTTLNVNSGNSGKTVTGVLGGSGTINNIASTGFTFSNTGNTFTGTVNSGYGMTFGNLGDSSSPISFSYTGGGGAFTWTGGAKMFALRPFTFNFAGTSSILNNGSGALIIQQNLAFSGAAGARTLQLGGSYNGSGNQFTGNITNYGTSTVGITKAGDNSIWALSGINTYSNATALGIGGSGNSGTLIFQGIQALSPYTSLNQLAGNTYGQYGVNLIKILDDSATLASRSGVNLNFLGAESVGSGDLRYGIRVFVGNNNTVNGGSSSSTQTGSTIQLGDFILNQGTYGPPNAGGLTVYGANGYKLQIANVKINLQSTYAGNFTAGLIANTAPLIVTGNVQQLAGSSGTVTLQLDGTDTTGSLISGKILDSADGSPKIMAVTKSNSSTWTLSGSNTYSGVTTISGGTLSVNSITNVNGGASSLGAVTNAVNGTIAINGGVLKYTGSGHTSDRVINLTGGATLDASGTGALVLSSPLTATAAGAKTLTLAGSSPAANTLGGAIVNGSGTTSVTKSGAGTWVLTAVNTYNGATTLVGGVLKVQNAGSGLTQTLGSLAVGGPDGTLQSDNAGSGTLSTTFTGLTARVAGNTANIVYTGGTLGTDNMINLTNAAGFIDKGLFLNGADYAAMNAPNTYVRALAYNTDANTTNNAVVSGKHVKLTATPAIQNTITLLSLNLSGGGVDYTQNAGQVLTVPGILKAGGGTSTLSGGAAITNAGVELVVRTDTNSDTLVVGTPVTGTGALTKSGAGTLTLSATNIYTGATYINGGTFEVGGAGRLGSGTYAASISNNATFLYSSTAAQTLSGVISGSGQLAKSGGSTLTLTGTNTYTGATTINGGTLEIGGNGKLGSGTYAAGITNNGTFLYNSSATQTLSGAISGSGDLVKSGLGLLLITGTNTCTGKTTVNAGTFIIPAGYLGANATLDVASGAMVVLNYSGTNTIGKLILNGSAAGPGVWGAANSGGLLSGSGFILIPPASGTLLIVQ